MVRCKALTGSAVKGLSDRMFPVSELQKLKLTFDLLWIVDRISGV